MTKSQELIEQILNIEWYMFQHVKAAGGSAPCQSAPDTFRKIRGSIFEIWTEELLLSYLEDLGDAEKKGRNLLSEKYARMDNLISPLNDHFLIDKIVEIETVWQEELKKKYPAFYEYSCRSTNSALDGSNFSIYLGSELETYSNKTIELYYDHVKKALEKGRNLSLTALRLLVQKAGYRDLDHAESHLCG